MPIAIPGSKCDGKANGEECVLLVCFHTGTSTEAEPELVVCFGAGRGVCVCVDGCVWEVRDAREARGTGAGPCVFVSDAMGR